MHHREALGGFEMRSLLVLDQLPDPAPTAAS